MKVILNQQVEIEGDNFPHSWSKEYISDTIPHKGDFIGDSIWKNPEEYIVESITIDYGEKECFVNIKQYSDEIPKSRQKDYAEMAGLHGWSASWKRKQ